MTVNRLVENDGVIEALQHAVHSGEVGLSHVPTLIKRVIREDRWRERVVRVTREQARFDRFPDFLTAHPPEGLGADLPLIKRMCADDPEAVDLIDQATANHVGRPSINNNIQDSTAPTGTSSQAAIRRLRKDRPELHQRVIAGEMSPHAAMVKAGFRHKTATVPVDDPDKVAAFLAKHFDPAEIRTIADLAIHLREGGD